MFSYLNQQLISLLCRVHQSKNEMVKKIFRIVLKTLLGIIAAIILFLVSSMLISKYDFGDPSEEIGERVSKLAFTHVNIVNVEADSTEAPGALIKNAKILLEEGKIVQILPDSVEIPKGYREIDAKGGFALPGLMDMHTHIFDRSDLAMYLGHGVTTVRNMMGFPMHLRWRQQMELGRYPGSRLITASPTINSGSDTGPFHKNIDTPEEAVEAITDYKEKGYDFIKIYDGLNYNQFIAVMQTANANDLYVAGHPPHGIGIDTLLSFNLNSFEHIEEIVQGPLEYELSVPKGRKIAQKFKAANARLTITMSPFHNIYRTTVEGDDFLNSLPKEKINPFIEFIGQKQMQQWVNCNKGTYDWNVGKHKCMSLLTQVFHEEDVNLLLGTDTGPSLTVPGLTLLDEIIILKDLDIPVLDIIKSGTIEAAKALQMDDEIGSIAIGKQAEMVIVKDNPLTDMNTLYNPVSIVKGETLYLESDIEELKGLGRQKSNVYLTLGRFLNHLISK